MASPLQRISLISVPVLPVAAPTILLYSSSVSGSVSGASILMGGQLGDAVNPCGVIAEAQEVIEVLLCHGPAVG